MRMRDYGYATLARGETLRGSSPDRVASVCELASVNGVPLDVVYRQRGRWVRAADITDPVERLAVGLPPMTPARSRPAGTTPVRVRWTVQHEGVIDVPDTAAATGRSVVAWLNSSGGAWTADVVEPVSGAPLIKGVIMPRAQVGGLASEADLEALAARVRALTASTAI